MRAAFYRPGDALPYAQVYQPITQPPEGTPVILGGTLNLVRPGFSEQAELRLSHPVPCQDGDHVRVWLDPELDRPDYLGEITSEPWAAGEGTVTLRGLTETVKAARWIGKAEGDFPTFFRAAVAGAVLPAGVTLGDLPTIDARFRADTPHELLGDTIQAISPAIGAYLIGVDNKGVLNAYLPSGQVTHRFLLHQSEMPPGRTENYANCVRFSFAYPSGDEAYFEGRNSEEITRVRREHWHEEQLTAREVGLPEEPLKGMEVEVKQGWRIGGQHLAELTATVPIERLGTPITKVVNGQAVYSGTPELQHRTWVVSRYKDEAGYTPAADSPLVRNDPTGAIYHKDAPPEVKHNAWIDTDLAAHFDISSQIGDAVRQLRQWLLDTHQMDVAADLLQRQLEVKLSVEYTRLGQDDGPLEALRLVQFQEGYNGLYQGEEYIDVLEWDSAQALIGVRVNPVALNAAPVNEVPLPKDANTTPTDPTDSTDPNTAPTDPTATTATAENPRMGSLRPDFYRLAIMYRAEYRNKLLAAGKTPQPILLRGGGDIGGVVIVGEERTPLFYPPTTPGKQYLRVGVPDIALEDALIELPFPLPVAGKAALEYAQQLTAKAGATLVTLPHPVPLPIGSAVLASLPAGSTLEALHVLSETLTEAQATAAASLRVSAGTGGKASIMLSEAEATYLYATTNKLGRALPATDNAPEAQARFAVRGEDLMMRTLVFNGTNDLTFTGEAGLRVETPQFGAVATYAAELLRYKSRPVRDWRGIYQGIRRASPDGLAVFERPAPAADEPLDVQRVTYNLDDQTTSVQAGTPLPATGADAVAGVIEDVRRVQRRAGGQ